MRNVLRIASGVLMVLFSLSFISCGGGNSGNDSSSLPINQEESELLETQTAANQFYEELEAENDSQALEKTVDFLKEQDNVENAAIGDDNTSIWIKYSSGVEAIILTKSFGTLNIDFSHRFKANQPLLKDCRLSMQQNGKKAIILLPIDSIPLYKDESVGDIESSLKQSGYSVEIYRDQSVTVDLMKTLSDYDVIYMATHGGVGFMGSEIGWNVQIMTGEIASVETIAGVWNLLIAGATSGLTLFSYDKDSKTVYFGLNCNFFKNYTYLGSFIYMNACSSFKKENLADAFLDNGASIFIGWDNIALLALGNFHNPELFSRLAEQNNTFKNAYDATIALYYPCSVYKDDNKKHGYHVLFLNGLDKGDMEDTTFDYALNLKYKGNPDFIFNPSLAINTLPVVSILCPADNDVFTAGGEVSFSGNGTDVEDGVLSDNSLVWTSDKDGQIGTGESSSITTLSVNTHIITLTATDSKGGVNTAEISIIVNEKICYGWSMWQFDARHSGRSPHRGPQTPTLKRIIDSGTISEQPMTDPNGIIYAVVGGWGERSFIRAFNSVGGSKKWERDISAMWDGGGELNGIAINNGILYASLSRSIYALNATDGTTKWRKEVGILFPGADVTLYHNLLYFYSSEGLQVLDTDGNTKWLYQIDPYERCLAPAISSDGVAYICGDTNLRAIDANGNLLWKCEIGVNNAEEMSSLPFPVVIAPNGTIYIMTYRSISLGTPHSYYMKESRLSVINPDGTLKWKYQVFSNQ